MSDSSGDARGADGASAVGKPQESERQFFGHPWGLANLFGVEMWERFSFYGMQALVLLYMYYSVSEGGLEIPKAAATSIVGAYGGLVYMACLLASLVADRVLGAERTLYYSAIMVMLGHLALAFIPAVTGLAIGLVQYTLMRGSTIKEAGHEVPNPVSRQQLLVSLGVLAVIVVVCVWLIASGVVKLEWLSNIVTVVAFLAAVTLWLQMYRSRLTTPQERGRMLGFIPMFVSGVLFFGIFQQQFTVLTIYSDMRLDRHIFGIEIPPSMVQLINPIFIVIFSSVFAFIWTKLGDRQWSTPTKFGIANVIIGVSLFFFLSFSGGGPNSTPMFAIIWILFLFTMGELLLSPVGNSLATKVAPQSFPSRMMAVWMMAVAMGTSLAGTLAGFYNPNDAGAENTFFITLGIVSIALGVVLLALAKWVVSKFATFR